MSDQRMRHLIAITVIVVGAGAYGLWAWRTSVPDDPTPTIDIPDSGLATSRTTRNRVPPVPGPTLGQDGPTGNASQDALEIPPLPGGSGEVPVPAPVTEPLGRRDVMPPDPDRRTEELVEDPPLPVPPPQPAPVPTLTHQAPPPVDTERLVEDLLPDLRIERQTVVHEVQPGDTLSGIATRYLGSSGSWRQILDANRSVLSDPNRLQVGMRLTIPGASGEATPADTRPAPATTGESATSGEARIHVVQAGETLTSIAARYFFNTGESSLQRIRYSDGSALPAGLIVRPGMHLRILPPPSPDSPEGRSYTIRPGDTLSSIARSEYGSSAGWKFLYDANRDRISDPARLQVGQVLRVPPYRAP